jgi:hypothetical protein
LGFQSDFPDKSDVEREGGRGRERREKREREREERKE